MLYCVADDGTRMRYLCSSCTMIWDSLLSWLQLMYVSMPTCSYISPLYGVSMCKYVVVFVELTVAGPAPGGCLLALCSVAQRQTTCCDWQAAQPRKPGKTPARRSIKKRFVNSFGQLPSRECVLTPILCSSSL